MPRPRTLAAGLALALVSTALTAPARPARTFDLQHLKWRLSLDPVLSEITGDVTNTVVPLAANTKSIWLDCAVPGIKMVSVNGKAAKYRVLNERMTIFLAKPAGPKDKLDVRIMYAGRPERGLYFTPAKNAFPGKTPMAWTQGQPEDTHCYVPTYDYPDDKTTTEAILEAPGNWTVLSNGKLQGTTAKGDRKVWHFKMSQPHSTYLISLLAGPMSQKEEKWGNVPVRYFVPVGLEGMGESSFAGTDKMVDFFSKLMGVPYPYPVFSQAVIPDYMYGGMENITAVTNTVRTLQPSDWRPLRSSTGLVLHELAHQWFGDLVTCKDWSHAWINEGFASFLPAFWTRETYGVDEFDYSRLGTLNGAIGAITAKNWPVVTTKYEHPSDIFDGNAYGGGSARMYVLMGVLGEKQFWASLKKFVNDYSFKSATTGDFFASFEKTTGKDFDKFMKQWFYTAETPKLVITRQGDDLVIAQAQSTPFTLELPVWIWNGFEWNRKSVTASSAFTRVPLGSMKSQPVLVDPEVWLIATIDDQTPYSKDQLLTMWRNAPNAAAKGRLLDKMAATLSPLEFLNLTKAEKWLAVTKRMIPKVQDVPYLISLSQNDNPEVANEAVNTLKDRNTPESIARLKEVFESHPHPAVRQTAYTGLVQLTKDADLVEKAWTMPAFDDSYRVAALRWLADNKPDVARDRALAFLLDSDSETLRIVAVETLAKVKDKPGQKQVFEALMTVAKERTYGARRAAVDGLGNYGDAAALPVLVPLQNNVHLFLRRSAKAAVDKLKK